MFFPDKILLLLGLLACSLGQEQPQRGPVELVQATSQAWIAGVPGGGSGINYRLQLKINTDRALRFDSIWVAGKKLALRLESNSPDGVLRAARHEVVTVLAFYYRAGPAMSGRTAEAPAQVTPPDSVPAPIPYQGAALLKYVVDGAPHYYAVPQMTTLPSLFRQ